MVIIYCTASFGIVLIIYPAFLDDRAVTGTQIEILYFAFGVSRVATLAFAGPLASRASATVVAAALAIAAGLGVSFAASGAAVSAVAMLLMGFGFSIIFC